MAMEIDVKSLNSYTREMDVTVPWGDLESKFKDSFSKFRRKHAMPGFRKGKVPEAIIRKNYGPALEIDFAERGMNEYYQLALDDRDLHPINQATIKALEFHEGQSLHFIAEFQVRPEVELPNYKKSIRVEVTRVMSTKTDVELTLQDYQERLSTVEPVESGAQPGHLIMADFQQLDESGVPLIGKKDENQYIRLGQGIFTGDVEAQLTGVKVDDVVRVDTTIEDASRSFELTVKRVEKQIIPELNDEFAHKADPESKTLEDFKAKVAQRIDEKLESDFLDAIKQGIIDHFVNSIVLEVPPSWKESYLDSLLDDFRRNQPNAGEIDQEQVRQMYEGEVIRNIKWHMIRDALVAAEKLEVSDEGVQEWIDREIAHHPDRSKHIKVHYKKKDNRNRLRDELLDKALFSKLAELATIKEKKKTTDALRKEQQKA